MSVEPDYTHPPIEVDPPAGLVFDSESGQWIVAAEDERGTTGSTRFTTLSVPPVTMVDMSAKSMPR